MTKFNEIIEALNAGAKVVVGLNSYFGAADVAKFVAKYENNPSLHYAQVAAYYPGVKYRTNLLVAG